MIKKRPSLDKDIEVRHLLAGIPSQESQHSLQRWLEGRSREQVDETDGSPA